VASSHTMIFLDFEVSRGLFYYAKACIQLQKSKSGSKGVYANSPRGLEIT